ncbi:NlpC/P60 family protein [Actinoplanes sp. NPDC023936]|uniref:C40 family peptidase n=1 Tax=Actinoplanes sp. NPDC023936 TaxID=3154910 RepID=UPI0033CC2F02
MAQQRVSRSIPRRPAVLKVRPVASPVLRASKNPAPRVSKNSVLRDSRNRVVERAGGRIGGRIGGRVDGRVASRVAVRQKRVTVAKRGAVSVRKTTRSTTTRRLRAAGGGRDMSAVIAFARSQVGKRYVPGGEGPHGFDCSGFTKRAYAKAGLSLPHSSGGQARRARNVARSQARPGDLVVGPGHVGIYMGRGMMIDAGNSRTGVVYRKVYRGLRVARLGR